MKNFMSRLTIRWLCAALFLFAALWSTTAPAIAHSVDSLQQPDASATEVPGQAFGNIGPYSYGFYTITEGMRDFPIQKQLSNTFPLSMDFSIIVAIGWTGDKLTIKMTDDYAKATATEPGDPGDRLVGIALVQYGGEELVPYWSTVFSDPTHDTLEMILTAEAPSFTIYLMSWYWGPSTGANPYTYTIYLSFPQ
jgi:hypothetical protein